MENEPTVSILCCSCGLVWFSTQILQYLGFCWSKCHKIYITRKLWIRRIHTCTKNLDVATTATTRHKTNSYQCPNWNRHPWHMTWCHHCLIPKCYVSPVSNGTFYMFYKWLAGIRSPLMWYCNLTMQIQQILCWLLCYSATSPAIVVSCNVSNLSTTDLPGVSIMITVFL